MLSASCGHRELLLPGDLVCVCRQVAQKYFGGVLSILGKVVHLRRGRGDGNIVDCRARHKRNLRGGRLGPTDSYRLGPRRTQGNGQQDYRGQCSRTQQGPADKPKARRHNTGPAVAGRWGGAGIHAQPAVQGCTCPPELGAPPAVPDMTCRRAAERFVTVQSRRD